jgi:hypothetical protein
MFIDPLIDALIVPSVPVPLWRDASSYPELALYAEIVSDAVRLVRGEKVMSSDKADVRAARYWIKAGNVGAVTFDACCALLGWDAAQTRRAIFTTAPPIHDGIGSSGCGCQGRRKCLSQ